MSSISIKQLLEAGVHFGHQTSRWNPKMKEFIFGERNGIHIIDLQKTMVLFKDAVDFLTDLAAQGKEVLFVGTKRQAHEAIEEDAIRCGMHFVTNRWLGGLLTNFETVRNSIKRYKELEGMREDGFYSKLTSKKEIAQLERERKRLDKNLRGIREMDRLPDALFVIDSDNEAIAVKEANRLGIPVVAVVDTNCDPDEVDYIVPGNDDALRSVKLFTSTIADALAAGRSVWQARIEEQRRAREQAEKEEAARAAAAKAAAEARRAEREKARAAEAEAEAVAAAAETPESEGEVAKESATPEAEAPAEGKAGTRKPAAGPTAEEAEAAAEAAAGETEAEKGVAEKPAGRKDKSEPVKTEKSERESTEEKKSKPTKPKGPRKKAAAESKTDKAEEPAEAASAKEESTEESKEAGSSKKKTSAKKSEDSEEVAADN